MDLAHQRPGRYIGLDGLYEQHRRQQFDLELHHLSEIHRALLDQGAIGRAAIVKAQMHDKIQGYQISNQQLVGSNG